MSEKASSYRDAFLFCVSQTGNLTMAAEFVGITRADVMADMRADPSFETDVQNAKEEAFDRLRYQTVQRAIEGIEVPRYYQGEIIGHTRHYSDSLLRFILHFEKEVNLKTTAKSKQEASAQIKEFRAKLKQKLSTFTPESSS